MEFSVTEASLAGFKLIGRRPVSALVWALAWILLGYGGLAALLYLSGAQLADALKVLPQAGGDPKALGLAALQFELSVVRVVWPWGLWAWIVSIVLHAAVYRAVIEPRRRGFAYLRIGGDELRLGLLAVIYFVLVIVFWVVVGLACAAAIAASGQLAQPARGLAIAAVVIAAICVSFVVLVRLMLAGPMTFARKRLQIFDSWRVTRGRFWALLGMLLLVVIFALAIGFAVSLIRNAVMIGPMSDMMREAVMHPGEPGRMLNRIIAALNPQTLSPMIAAFVVVQGLADTLLRVIVTAPFAESYRVLTTPPAPPAPLYEPAPVVPSAPAEAAAPIAAVVADHDSDHDAHGHADPHAPADEAGHGDGDHGDADEGGGGGNGH